MEGVKIQVCTAWQIETRPSNSEGWLPQGWQVVGSLVGRLLIRLCHQAPTMAHHRPLWARPGSQAPTRGKKINKDAKEASSNIITWYFSPFRCTAINSKHNNLNSIFLVPTKK